MASPITKRFSIAFKKFWWMVPIPIFLGSAAGGFVAIQPPAPPTFKAQGLLSTHQQAISFSETGAAILAQGQSLSEDVLLGPDVVQNVASLLKVSPKEVLKSAKVKALKAEAGAEPAAKGAPPAPGPLQVSYEDDNGRRAIKAVNALMTQMVEKSRTINTARLQGIIDAIEKRLPLATQELRESEQRLEYYDRVEGAAILTVQNGSLVSAIAGSREQQRQLRLQLAGITAQVQSLEARLGLTVDEAYVASALSSDPIINGLRGQLQQIETELTMQSKRLRSTHPTIVQLAQRQAIYSGLLQQRASEVLGGGGQAKPFLAAATKRVRTDSNLDPARQQLANLLVGLKTQQETLMRQMALAVKSEQELRREYSSIPNKQLERDRLAQQVALKKALYDRMQAKLVDSRAAEVETVSSLALAKPAEITDEQVPKSPRAILLLLAGGAGGLVLAMVILLVLGFLDGRFRAASEIRAALSERDVKLLGLLPTLAIDPEHPKYLPLVQEEDGAAIEAYERFRSTLRRLNPRLKVIMVGVAAPGEGKSVVAYNLAVANARAGRRTLLLELDLRSPSAARSLGLAPDPIASAEPFKYYENLGECVRLVPMIENFYIVPSPGPHPAAAALLESRELEHLIEDARSRFDMVIVEATSFSAGNDAFLLEPKTDGTILVARPDITEKKTFGDRLDEFTDEENSTVKFLGVAIDDADSIGESLEDEEHEEDSEFHEHGYGPGRDDLDFADDLAAEFSLDRNRRNGHASADRADRSSANGNGNGNNGQSNHGGSNGNPRRNPSQTQVRQDEKPTDRRRSR